MDEGRIVYIGKDNLIVGKKEMDADGDLVLPGGIDTHVHIREPEMCQRGTFQSETAAAAAGGITTIFEMPISAPPQYCPEILQKRIDTASLNPIWILLLRCRRPETIFQGRRRPVLSVSKHSLLPCQDGIRSSEEHAWMMMVLWQGMRAVAETGLTLPFMLK